MFFVILIISLLLEATFTTIPLLLVVFNLYTIIYKKEKVFAYAFLFGGLFDILAFKSVGLSPFLLILFLAFVLLYKRKFEIETSVFVVISTFLGSLIYLFFIFSKPLVLESFLASIISVIVFKILGKVNNYG